MENMNLPSIIAIVVIVTAIFSFISYRQKQSSWSGKVVSKKKQESSMSDDGYSTPRYYVTFETGNGKRIRLDMTEKDFDKFNIGDQAEKKAGDYFPTKL